MRRDPLEIIERLISILQKEKRPMTINQLAKCSGIHNITVKKYIRIIQIIKQEPDIDVINTNHSIIIRVARKKTKRYKE